MKTKKEFVNSWVKKAARDLSFLDAVTESICFHCQQATEKFLKAYLVFLDISFTKTNEIGELITKCQNRDREIFVLKEEADRLTDYAVAVRYPEEPFEPTLGEAKEAFGIAKRIGNLVLDKISSE